MQTPLLVAALVALLASQAAPAQPALIITDTNVVDVARGTIAVHRDIVVEAGRIAQIVPAARRTARAGQRLDGRGAYVVPGYLDMHSHSVDARDSLRGMLANGITGYRQMSGSPEMLARDRAGQRHSVDGLPELLALPGTILTMENAATPEAAVAEVRRQQAMGADFIKMIDVPPPAFFAAQSEATRLGLKLVGHLPPLVDVAQATRAGMHSIEHMGPKEGIILGCSSDEAALRANLAASQPRQIQTAGIPPKVFALALANPIIFTTSPELARLQREVDTFDPVKCRGLMRSFVADDTWQVPTLIRLQQMELGADGSADPSYRYMSLARRELLKETAKTYAAKFSPQQQEIFRRLFDYQLRLVKLFGDNGVKMMVGTDGMWVPGFGYHSELDLLARAGLSPLRVLQMATIEGARFLHREASIGSVAPGQDANLVVLRADPLTSVQNLHQIRGVVLRGHYYDEAALAAMKQEVADHVGADRGKSVDE